MDWISVVIGLIGALVGGGATLLANRQTHKKQHADWLRREKIDAYTEILKFYRSQNRFPRRATDDIFEISFTSARARLISPPRIIDMFEKCQEAFMDAVIPDKRAGLSQDALVAKFFKSLESLEKAMTEDLKRG